MLRMAISGTVEFDEDEVMRECGRSLGLEGGEAMLNVPT